MDPCSNGDCGRVLSTSSLQVPRYRDRRLNGIAHIRIFGGWHEECVYNCPCCRFVTGASAALRCTICAPYFSERTYTASFQWRHEFSHLNANFMYIFICVLINNCDGLLSWNSIHYETSLSLSFRVHRTAAWVWVCRWTRVNGLSVRSASRSPHVSISSISRILVAGRDRNWPMPR